MTGVVQDTPGVLRLPRNRGGKAQKGTACSFACCFFDETETEMLLRTRKAHPECQLELGVSY